jgi:hypothetical protein
VEAGAEEEPMPPGRTRVLWASAWILVLVLGAAGLVLTVQGVRFEERVAGEARSLWAVAGAPPAGRIDPSSLPPPVRRYAEISGALRRAPIRTARLRHGGTFLAGGRWRPIRGVQYLSADPPGFVWWGRIRIAPGVWVDGRDRSVAGEGSMWISAVSTWTIADARGPELDQSALQRLLAELTWIPTALLDGRHVTWAPIDERSARATLRVGGRAVAATFHFGQDGLPERFTGERYREVDGRGVLTPFIGKYADYRVVDGVRVPFRVEAAWQVAGWEQPYARWQIQRIELDHAEPFP